jgi:hypothetical protein
MKKIVIIMFILTTSNSIACPEITGKYLCTDLAEEALGTRILELKKDEKIYSLKLEDETYYFEVGTWNRGLNHSEETMAECSDTAVNLKTRGQIVIGQNTYNINGSIDLTPSSEGVLVSLKTQGEEVYSFGCEFRP